MDLLRIGTAASTQLCEHIQSKNLQLRLGENEKALFMIDDVFIQNRLRSVMFTKEVEDLIQIKKETLTDLGLTQIELASKI